MPRPNTKAATPARRTASRTASARFRGAVVGTPVPRREAPDKLLGRTVYVDDVPLPAGGVYVRTIRSRIAHGRVAGVRFGPQVDWSRIAVVTARDIPGRNFVQHILQDQPALADGLVRHREEPILLLAHEDRELLERAVRAVEVDCEPLPAALTIADSRRGDVRIFGDDNVFKHCRIRRGDARAAMEHAAVRVRGRYTTPAQEHAYVENSGVLARFEPDGTLVVQGSMQCPYYVHKAMVPLLGLPAEKVRVVQCETGGGFGGKEDWPSVLAAHAALVARVTGRPAKLVYDREEDMLSTPKRHAGEVEIETGFDEDGRLVAMIVDVAMNGGAYSTMSPVVLSRGALHAGGPYRCENTDIEARAYATNLVPAGAFRGFGAPQTLFAIEAHMDACAAAMEMDPVELRRRNLMDRGATTATGQNLGDDVAARDAFESALELSGWKARRAAAWRRNRAGGQVRRGLGVSVVLHGSGFTGNGERNIASRAAVDTLPDGRLRLLAAAAEIGQGRDTVLSQLVAEELGIEVDDVVSDKPDTFVVPNSGPTVASRTTMIVGGLLREAAAKLRAELEEREGHPLRSRLAFQKAVRGAHARGESPRAEVGYVPPAGVEFDDATYTGSAYGTYAWMATVAEVDVDLVTCETRVTDLWMVPEAGTIVNPVLARGQIEGGALQAVGWALLEDVRLRDGTMWNPRLSDYILPTSADAPRMHVRFLDRPCALGPFGAKGLGELPFDGPAGAIVAAIRDAVDVLVHDLPATPERVSALLSGADVQEVLR